MLTCHLQLAASYLNLSSSVERAIKAYLDHTQVVLNGDATLNVGHMLGVFGNLGGGGAYGNPAHMASMALQHNGLPQPEIKSEEPEKKRKRAYKPRDRNAPKRPLTAYFRFLQEVRPHISEEIRANPEKYTDLDGKKDNISQIATRRWKELSEDEQKPYKTAYEDELKEWTVKTAAYKAGDAEGGAQDVPVIAAAEEVEEQEDESSSDSSADTESEEEEEMPPPPPKASPHKKSSMKKQKTPASAAPASSNDAKSTFSSIPDAAPASSPTLKRKAESSETENSSKRGRKSKKTVTAGSDPVAPVAQMSSQRVDSPETIQVADGGKKKKEKKKKAKGDA